MKFTCLLLFICFASITAKAFQIDAAFVLPRIEDVQKIETTNNEFRYQTPESLLRKLSYLKLQTTGETSVCPKCQYGIITRKDGRILKWKSSRAGNFMLYDDKTQQHYVEDVSFWNHFLGKFVYLLTVGALFTLFTVYLVGKRSEPDDDYWKILIVRIAAFLLFAFFAYLLLQSPLQQLNDGIAVMKQRGGPDHLAFADTEPVNFRSSITLNSLFGFFPILCGIGFLLFNPKSRNWAKKPKPAIKKTSFLSDRETEIHEGR